MHIGALIQARMGSTRLPGKVMMDICGKPMIARVVERVMKSKYIDCYSIIIPHTPENDPLIHYCRQWGLLYRAFDVNESDVLERYVCAASASSLDVIVRITADCPLVDPLTIDEAIIHFLREPTDLAANNCIKGMNVEVFSKTALAIAHTYAQHPSDREHVTPIMYRESSGLRVRLVETKCDPIDLSVDTQEDLDRVRTLWEYFGHDRFTTSDILQTLDYLGIDDDDDTA